MTANESSDPQLDCSLLRIRFRTIYPIDKWKSDGYFTEDDILDIDCYWMQFEPIKPTAHFILAILYVIIFIVGCTSNAIVIYILVRLFAFFFAFHPCPISYITSNIVLHQNILIQRNLIIN